MTAVGFATVGLALEIATTAFPANFIVLAGLGNFAKALGKGLSSPSFRIIQTHFALDSNVGEVSAKEEVEIILPAIPGQTQRIIASYAICNFCRQLEMF